MNYKVSWKLGKVLVLASAVSLVAGIAFEQIGFTLLCIALMAVDVVQTKKFYRCPHCDGKFDMREEPPCRCPHCGREL